MDGSVAFLDDKLVLLWSKWVASLVKHLYRLHLQAYDIGVFSFVTLHFIEHVHE